MAKRHNSTNKKDNSKDFVQVDAYLIPAAQAEMYRILREAVADEMVSLLQARYPQVQREILNPDEGEAIVAYDSHGQVRVCFHLNPGNISEAQKARDKDQLDKLVLKFEMNE
ncbi:hypothetical protein [Vaginisenegalia massiliensis]|uniref:hypothetical protein n=1 Tax=Vaginisenegalia massiliensis TaxID=2058294 RepID=UPI000F531AC9|nr:hypothetical protein [Vaginisenegalia massiliensis]